jgi:hypothetical protein
MRRKQQNIRAPIDRCPLDGRLQDSKALIPKFQL